MDIILSIVKLSDEKFYDYLQQIQESNLTKFTQNGRIDLLKTAREQTQQAKRMGWL